MSAEESQCDAVDEKYPTIKKSPFVWIPSHLEADGVRPKFRLESRSCASHCCG